MTAVTPREGLMDALAAAQAEVERAHKAVTAAVDARARLVFQAVDREHWGRNEVARALGLDGSYVSKILAGGPPPD